MPFIGQEPITGAYHVLDDITTSATATYNLQLNSGAFSPATANQLLVSLNGVIQKPGSSFTISGSQITFSSALTPSDSIDFIIALGDVLNVGTPTDGTVSAAKIENNAINLSGSKVTGTLPVGSGGTGITSGFKNGIETADMWRMTTAVTTADNRSTGILTDWQRVYQINGVTEANGVFTFPSTGIYEIELAVRFYTNSSSARHLGGGMLVSTDSGSSFSNSSLMDDVTSHMGHVSSNTYMTCTTATLFDVTNASTQRVKFFGRSSDSSGLQVQGTANLNYTWVKFVRLGDT